jgi:molybdopterin molybdotransferase
VSTLDIEMNNEYDPEATSLEQALQRMQQEISPVGGYEQLSVRAALGRVLAEDVRSPLDVPAYTNSAMDGYVLAGTDLPTDGKVELRIIGEALAGRPYSGTVRPGECVHIMTGGMVPEGADTVLREEDVERRGEVIIVGSGYRPGAFVRPAGEDVAVGQLVLQAGRPLHPADIGLIASLGIAEVKVKRQVRVAFFSTGDELRSLGEPLETGQIYDSNRYTVHGMLTRLGVDLIDMGVVRDRQDELEHVLSQAAGVADAIITSGGISFGQTDYVKETLERMGTLSFWRIAMKPGRPLAFGRIQRAWFFGLPGNPVSVMVTFYELVQPALRRLMGQAVEPPLRLRVPCVSPLKKTPGRQDFQRGILHHNAQGRLVVRSTGPQGSGVLSSMSQANCFIIVPTEWGNVEPGTEVEVEPFAGLV